MPNSRVYSIKINGISESVDLVDSLLKKLNELEQRINTLSGKTVSIGAGTASKGGSAELSAEERVQKKIESTVHRIEEARTREYKTLVEAKNELKETERQQKAVAAAQRLSGEGAKQYANTLDGMRQKLIDMKRALGGTELGSADFTTQVQEINALNQKIKEIEQSYGVFGRNVGNYVNGVTDGMQKLTITVNGSERTFSSARDALRSLGNELKTMAVQGKQGTKEYEELDRTFKQLKSTIDDVSKSSQGMDMLLDTMQGFTALGSVGNGFASLFGFDDNEIQKSIQKLVALQSAMQGLETIRKQMTTNEGLGKIFNDGNAAVDQFVSKITGAKVGVEGLETSSKKTTIAVRGLSMAMKAVGVGLMMWAAVKAMEQLQKAIDQVKTTWHNAFGEMATEEERAEMRMKALNAQYEHRNALIQSDLQSGKITQEQAYAQQIDLQNSYLQKQIGLLNDRNKLSATDIFSSVKDNLLSGKGLIGAFGDLSDKMIEYIASSNAAKKSDQELAESIEAVGDDVKVVSQRTGEAAEEIVNRWAKAITSVDLKTEEGRKTFDRLYREMNDNKWLSTILCNLDKYIPDDAARARIQNIISSVNGLKNAMDSFNPTEHFLSLVDPTYGNKQRIKEINAAWDSLPFFKQQDPELKAKYQNSIKEQEQMIANGGKRAVAATSRAGRSVADETKKQEEELIRLRIRLMQEGLQKTLAQIDADAQKEIDALKLSGARREEALKLIDDYYNQRRVEAKRKNNEEIIRIQRELNNQLLRMEAENVQQQQSITERASENFLAAMRQNITLPRGAKDNPLYKLYFNDEHPNRAQEFTINFDLAVTGDERVLELLSEENRAAQLKYWDKEWQEEKISGEEFGILKHRLETVSEDDVRKAVDEVNRLVAKYMSSEGDPSALATEYTKKIDDVMRTIGMTIDGTVRDFQYDSLESLYEDGLEEMRQTYYKGILEAEQKTSDETYNIRKSTFEKIAELEREEATEQQRERIGNFEMSTPPADDVLRRFLTGKLTDADSGFTFGSVGEDFKKLAADTKEGSTEFEEVLNKFKNSLAQFWNEYQKIQQNINGQKTHNLLGLDVEKAQRDSQNISNYYAKMVSDIERVVSSTQQKYSTLPDTDAFGIVNVGATQKKINETINAYKYLQSRLVDFLQDIRTKFSNGEITTDAFESLSDRITAQLRKISEAIKLAKGDSQNLLSDFINSIMPYAQQLVNGLSGVFNELSNLWNEQYNNRMKLLEEENDRLEELYSRQEEIEAKHRDNLLLIEDEIATARGARREYLVDQYNEEIAAQRRAVAEAKRLDEEKRKNELKQKALEKQERKRQNKIQLAQAMMSQSLAIMNAFATQPFLPVGLAMGALATTLTAAQIVLMIKAQKESEKYAEGGVIVGRSHKQGGVKVLGGKAEVEGGEYITNKRTTALNQPVLDFINSKKQRLELSDFISFYNGNQKHIKGNLKNKYADGGALPAANGKKDGNIIVIKDESRPVVSVTDIISATESYNRVQVLAGLE